MPRIDETHKEILFAKWDSWLKEAKQEMEEAAAVVNNVIE